MQCEVAKERLQKLRDIPIPKIDVKYCGTCPPPKRVRIL
jgi:hypothetical protein